MTPTKEKTLRPAHFERINTMPNPAKNDLIVALQQATGVSIWAVLGWLRRKSIPHWHQAKAVEIINQALELTALEPQHQ